MDEMIAIDRLEEVEELEVKLAPDQMTSLLD